jgi:hypothetical protein
MPDRPAELSTAIALALRGERRRDVGRDQRRAADGPAQDRRARAERAAQVDRADLPAGRPDHVEVARERPQNVEIQALRRVRSTFCAHRPHNVERARDCAPSSTFCA